MNRTVCVIEGDGVGREVIPPTMEVLQRLVPGITFQSADAGWGAFEATGAALPPATLERARSADATLLGAVASPSTRVEGYRSPVVLLRRELDLYACVRPVRTPPLGGARRGVDFVVVREATEGLYVGRERRLPGAATAERVVTEAASRRIALAARDLALREGRRKVTVVHKANVLRETCGLFRETVLETLSGSGLEVDELLVDAAAYRIATSPESLDVLVTTNLFGDILSDAAATWAGGIGLCASATLGDRHAVFEPVHGAAPDIAGRGVANPLATLRSAVLLLRHVGAATEASVLDAALDGVLRDGPRTPDLGGDARTRDVVDAVSDLIGAPVNAIQGDLS